jgi:hypothetical protein
VAGSILSPAVPPRSIILNPHSTSKALSIPSPKSVSRLIARRHTAALNLRQKYFEIVARLDRNLATVVQATIARFSDVKEFDEMSTAYEVKYPNDMMRASQNEMSNWTESTIQSVVGSIEEYAREKPIPFALWTFGIGFALGWKLKPW